MTLIELVSLFEARKITIIQTTGLDKDALHVYFGLALFLAVRLLWRRRGGWLFAWLAVLAMACTGEFLDMNAVFIPVADQPDPEHWHDIWNTMFWPTVLLIVGRWLQPKEKEKAAADAADISSGEDAERRLEQA